mgnify:FL=1
MKKIKTLVSALVLSFGAIAQAPLPSTENFNAFTSAVMQPGWSTNIGGTFTYGTGVSGTAAKFDNTAMTSGSTEYIMVNTADAMGVVSYYLKGWNTGGAWLGTFTLEESVGGTTWTALQTYAGSLSSTAYVQYTVTPNPSSRFLRWNFTSKSPNNNVGLDDVNITAAPVTAQEINVKQGTSTILNGGSSALFNSPVGTPVNVNFSIENLGSINTLSVSSINFSGPAASDFSVSVPASFPVSVSPISNIPLTLSFNPSVAGTRTATMTINSDDSDEGAYTIVLNGIGGTLATAPTTQATSLVFSGIKSYRAKANFTAATGSPNGYLILKKQGSSTITDIPVDGVAYQIGDAIGSSKVIFSTSANSFGISNVYAGLQYQVAIFTYNGSGSFTNYNQTAPLTGNFTSLATMQPLGEYTSLNTNAPTFLTDLSAKIYPHTSIFYGNYDETMVKLFVARDTTAGQKVLNCVYSGENYIYTEPMAWGYMSREHSYCHQWMPTNPADGSGAAPNNVERKEYNDQHHLFPTNQDDVNAVRSNYPMGEVITSTGTYLNCKWGLNASGNSVFEPRASHKGDFARAVMYMATAYNGQNNAFGVAQNWKFKNPISGTIGYGQDQNLLKKWHYQDPPDSYEIARNDFLDSLQGNRNPFIDSMRYACYIDFSNMTYISAPTYTTGVNAPCYVAVGLKENVATQFEYVLAPNPAVNSFYLLIDAKVAEKFSMSIRDVTGRIVYSKPLDIVNGFNAITVDDAKISSGIYFVDLTYKNEKITKKLIIQ